MSRQLALVLALCVCGVSEAFAGSLQINPFPMERATSITARNPELLQEDRVEAFAKEMQEDIYTLEQDVVASEDDGAVIMTPMPDDAYNGIDVYADPEIDLSKVRIKVLSDERPDGDAYVDGQNAIPLPQLFEAQAGTSLEDVLRSWTQIARIGFLWKTKQNFQVLQGLRGGANFEDSVTALLDQFGDTAGRPVGQLSTDPVTGVKTFSVLTE